MSSVTNNQSLTPTGEIARGIFANTVAATVMQPGFVFKTYFQNNLGWPPIKVLHRGLFPNLLGGGFLQASAFSANSLSQKHFPEATLMQSFAISLLSGAVGAQIATVAERIMILQQVQGLSTKNVVKSIIEREGFPGFFKGNVPTMCRESTFIAGIFTCIPIAEEKLKPAIANNDTRKFVASLTMGAFVGWATNGFDRIKTIMQADTKKEHTSFVQTTRHIIKIDGVKSLFKGAAPRSITIAGLIYGIVLGKDFFLETPLASPFKV